MIQTFQSFWGIKRETTVGTYNAPALAQDFMFVTLGLLEFLIEDNVDESYQGIAAKEAGFYPGWRYGRVTIEGPVSQLPMPHLWRAALGNIATTGAGDPFTQTITARTAQGPSYTLVNFDGTQAPAWSVQNARLQSLEVRYVENKGMFTYKAVFLGKYPVSQTKPSSTFDTAPQYVPYENALTLGGSANGKMVAMTLKIDNECEPVPGSTGTQDVNDISQGRITTVALDAIFAPIDLTELNFFLNNSQPVFSALFTNTASHTLTLQMSKLAFANGTRVTQDKPYIRAAVKAKGIQNATDTGPIKVIHLNSIAAGGY